MKAAEEMTREKLKAEALIDLGSEPAPKEWGNIPCIKEQMPSLMGGEVSLQRFTGTDICAWFIGMGGLWQPHSDYFQVSLPPAEGAKKVQWSGYGELGNISQKPLQPTAEGAEEILTNLETYYDFKFHWIERDRMIRAMHEFATLHAQKIADKMVEEMLREELMTYDKFLSNTYWGISHITKREEAVNEYLKSRER